jgi:hypothetical protein
VDPGAGREESNSSARLGVSNGSVARLFDAVNTRFDVYPEKRFGTHYLRPMKRPLLALAILTTLCGCISTNYYTYPGSGIYEGKGGASKNVNGDIWLVGTPLRKFRIIGYITDSRPGGLIPMATGMLISLLKQRRTEATGSYSKPIARILSASTRQGMRRLSPTLTSPRPLDPAYQYQSFGEKANISSSM